MTQGWGDIPPGGTGGPGGPGGGEDDATRSFAPVDPGAAGASGTDGAGYQYNPFQSERWLPQGQGYPQEQEYPQGQGYPQGPQNTGGHRGNGMGIALVIVVVLLVIALGVLLATQWNNIFGTSADGEDATATPVTTTVVVPGGSGEDSTSTPRTTSASRARPTSAALPGGVAAVNSAALNGEPTGNFNSIWLSGPTTAGFAENVRNAYVNAYRVDRKTNQTVSASSPTTGLTYTMTCVDQGSYIHCTGGNNANVYIA